MLAALKALETVLSSGEWKLVSAVLPLVMPSHYTHTAGTISLRQYSYAATYLRSS
jgi:hypothetical protein